MNSKTKLYSKPRQYVYRMHTIANIQDAHALEHCQRCMQAVHRSKMSPTCWQTPSVFALMTAAYSSMSKAMQHFLLTDITAASSPRAESSTDTWHMPASPETKDAPASAQRSDRPSARHRASGGSHHDVEVSPAATAPPPRRRRSTTLARIPLPANTRQTREVHTEPREANDAERAHSLQLESRELEVAQCLAHARQSAAASTSAASPEIEVTAPVAEISHAGPPTPEEEAAIEALLGMRYPHRRKPKRQTKAMKRKRTKETNDAPIKCPRSDEGAGPSSAGVPCRAQPEVQSS